MNGKLHKGFEYGDASYGFGKKKKRSLSKNHFLYHYGLSYQIYSATPGYQRKHSVRKMNNFI
jgi:hypothetical protein